MIHNIILKPGDSVHIHVPATSTTIKYTMPKPQSIPTDDSYNLIHKVCDIMGVPVHLLLSKRRTPELVAIRCYIANKLLTKPMNTTTIGRLLNRDHSTIIHYKGLQKDFLDTKDPLYIETIKKIENETN